jgi:DNA-binding SARP family transcriptional activator
VSRERETVPVSRNPPATPLGRLADPPPGRTFLDARRFGPDLTRGDRGFVLGFLKDQETNRESDARHMPQGQRLTLPANARLILRTLGEAALGYAPPDTEPRQLLGPGKPLALLCYLAFSPRHTASREHLLDLLWADLDPARAQHALRQTVWQIRHLVSEAALETHNGDLVLGMTIESDRDAFLHAVQSGALERAVELYAGEFLPDFATPGGAEFEQWADLERIRLRTAFLRCAESRVRRLLAGGHVRDAQRLARRARDADRLNESGWRLLLETLVASHDYLSAAIEADALEQLLRAEEREPEPATTAALRLARQSPETPTTPAKPTLLAELIGREKEFATIVSAWEAARRRSAQHIQIVAPAGLGKTRLLQDVLARLRAGGARALYLRANPGERQIPYAFAGDLAAALAALPGATGVSAAVAATLVSLNPALSSTFSAAAPRESGDDALRRRLIALSDLLLAVADDAPVALLLDDLHWADPQSFQIVNGMLGRIAGGRILLVCATRPSGTLTLEREGATRITLRPLSVGQVGALIGSLGAVPGEPWAQSLPGWLHASTGGSPLLVLESLQLALERGSLVLDERGWHSSEPLALAAELAAGGALRHRVEQLDRTPQWLLLTLAAAGTPLSSALLARLAGRPESAITPLLQGLEERGLVVRAGTEWEPGHDEIAALSLGTAAPEALRAAHATLGLAFAADAEGDLSLTPHAVRHLAAGEEDRKLAEPWARWVRERRRRGDRRPLRVLAGELLGEAASEARVTRLVTGLPVAVRLGVERRWPIAAAVLAALALTGAAIAAVRRPAPPVAARLLAFQPRGDDRARALEFTLRQGEWQDLQVLDLRSRPVTTPLKAADFSLRPGPSSFESTWVTTHVFPDSGSQDLVLITATGQRRRLTFTRRDDGAPSFSPDGQSVVFTTARWNTLDHYDIAMLRLGNDSVIQLTQSDASDGVPFWSPDGARIAYSRRFFDGRAPEVCWRTPNRRHGRCFLPPGLTGELSVVGWLSPNRLLVTGDNVDSPLVISIDLPSLQSRVLAQGYSATVSSDGRWMACLCHLPGRDQPTWVAFPTDHPEDVREVQLSDSDAGSWRLSWNLASRPPRYIDHVAVITPRYIPLDIPEQLRAKGYGPDGTEVGVPIVDWTTSDTAIATIDSTGLLRPRRVGHVVVHASAGGWREDSVTLVVRPLHAVTRLTEDWSGAVQRNFEDYGIPRPKTIRDAGGRPAFLNNGDGSYESGAYSKLEFEPEEGLGVEAVVSTPVNRSQWQELNLGFDAGIELAASSGWDRSTGYLPAHTRSGRTLCHFGYPKGEGAGSADSLALVSSGSVMRGPAQPAVEAGRWYTVSVQIFPDGRCGLAINGEAVLVVETQLPLDRPYRLDIDGNSVGTQILVGPLEVWEGVKGGVDWSVLSAQRP